VIGDGFDRRAVGHDDREVDRCRARRGHRAHSRPRCIGKNQRCVAKAADVDRARIERLAERLCSGEVEPFDLVRDILQLTGRFENAARLQLLIADFQRRVGKGGLRYGNGQNA
jgi:hypothetical protein